MVDWARSLVLQCGKEMRCDEMTWREMLAIRRHGCVREQIDARLKLLREGKFWKLQPRRANLAARFLGRARLI